jgi:histidinol-phosphate/aromatic aminotransferase/cobyric acid decarboxylase-like protein
MDTYLIGAVAGLSGLVAGYALARLDGIYSLLRQQPANNLPAPSSFFATKLDKKQAAVEARVAQVSIDESKFVTDIKTDNISKVNELELGKTTTQQDTLNQSVSKLAQLKGR